MSDAQRIRMVVDRVYDQIGEEYDLSPSDIGHIVSLFLYGMAELPGLGNSPGQIEAVRRVADVCAAVKDE